MRRQPVQILALAVSAAVWAQPASAAGRLQYPIDTPLHTLRGPDAPTVSIIQTDIEIEYIGDYLALDEDRSKSALRLLGRVDFAENMLLVVNGGPVEGAMLRVDSIYEEDGVLHVEIVTTDPPAQYRDSEFASPTFDWFTPALVTVLPRFQGVIVVHTFPTQWATSGDLRGIQMLIQTEGDSDAPQDSSGGAGDGD